MFIVIGALMAGMVVNPPALPSAQASGVSYSEDLQLPNIPGTEWIQPAPVNECANPDPAWIFCDDFEQDRSAQYFEGKSFVSNNRTAGAGWNGSTAVKGAFKQGIESAGGMKVAFGKTPSSYEAPVSHNGEKIRELYYRMYLKNDANWIGGGGYKLSRVTSLAENWAQPFIGHVWSGNSVPGNPDKDYLLLDPASGTDETGNLLSTEYNDFDHLRWLNQKKGLTPIFSSDYVGKWYSIEVHIKLNDAGQSNGVFEYWINNTLQASKTGMNWVGNYDAYGINTVLFENFWNNGAPQDQNRYFDNIVISTQKIDKDYDVNPAYVSGGNAQLGWHAEGGLVEGGELVVSTDGTYDFGNLGPTMLYRQSLSDEVPGTQLSANVPVGRGTVQPANEVGSPYVRAVPELPYGKGLEIGTPVKKIYVYDNQVHTEFYEHYYVYWPAEHQDNAKDKLLAATRSWGIKGIWHYLDADGYNSNTKSDVFSSSPGWDINGKYFSDGWKVMSNDSPISYFDTTSRSRMRDPNDLQRWRSSPMLKQFWVKSGPTPGSAAGSDGLYRLTDTSTGMVDSKSYKDIGQWTAANAPVVGYDRLTIPGFVEQFNIADHTELYFADIYQAVGPGAAARIEITDNADYNASTKITILDIQNWANHEVSAKIRKGIFYQETLVGKYVHLHDANNNPIYIGQLQDNITVPPATAPGAPTDVTAAAGNGKATVTFTAPVNDGGSAITGYTVTASPGNLVQSGTGSPIVFTGLTNNTAYTFTVKAVNDVGSGLSSAASNTVVPGSVKITPVATEDAEFKQGVLIEAEDFTFQSGGTVTIADRGQSHTTGNPLGNMFYNWDNAGHLLEWEFNVPESGSYRIGMKYSSSVPLSLRDLQVDGGETYTFHYPRTLGGWGDFDNALLQDSEGNDLLFDLAAGTHKIRMTNVSSGLNLDYIVLHKMNDGPLLPPTAGAASITGNHDSLPLGSDLDLTVGVAALNGSFTALDAILDYDPADLSFATVTNGASVSLAESALELLKPNYTVMSAVNEAKGKIRILAFTQDEQNAVRNVGSLFKLHGAVKDGATLGDTDVTLEKFDVSLFNTSVSLDTGEAGYSFEIRLADNAALVAAIGNAQALHDEATEGELPGQYAEGSKTILLAAINAATTVSVNIHAEQTDVNAALQALLQAIDTFHLAVIPIDAVDRTILAETIASAQNRYNRTAEGNRVGLYQTGSRDALLGVIATASGIYALPSANQTQVNQADAALKTALSTFSTKIVTLVPGATAVTITDLSIILRYFGVTHDDPSWSEIERADVLNEGEITIQAIAAIAQMILDDWLLE